MNILKPYEGNDIDGWMDEEELHWLYNKASLYISVVEIGSWKGRSTHALVSGCKGTVHAIDHFLGNASEQNVHSEARTTDLSKELSYNLRNFSNLKIYKMNSIEAVKLFKPKSIEMVFIDGEHDYVGISDDLRAWQPIVTKFLCGHDRGQQGVPQALSELQEQNPDYKLQEGPGSIWYIEL